MVKLNNNIKLICKSLYLIKDKILVISDLHIGYEEQARNSGIYVPKTLFEKIKKEMQEIFNKVKPKRIIILGDLKHEFGRINKEEWKGVGEILQLLKKNSEEVILIKGNHDKILEPIAEKYNLTIKDYYINKGFAFFHGNKIWNELYDKKIKTWIIGHNHPAIMIRKHAKQEKYKCFLIGKFKDKNLIILPSFFPLIEGSKVNLGNTNLGFKPNLSNFKVYIVADDEVLDFKKLKDIKTF